jgi:hypothetical protein
MKKRLAAVEDFCFKPLHFFSPDALLSLSLSLSLPARASVTPVSPRPPRCTRTPQAAAPPAPRRRPPSVGAPGAAASSDKKQRAPLLSLLFRARTTTKGEMEAILDFKQPVNVPLLDQIVEAFHNPVHPQVRRAAARARLRGPGRRSHGLRRVSLRAGPSFCCRRASHGPCAAAPASRPGRAAARSGRRGSVATSPRPLRAPEPAPRRALTRRQKATQRDDGHTGSLSRLSLPSLSLSPPLLTAFPPPLPHTPLSLCSAPPRTAS